MTGLTSKTQFAGLEKDEPIPREWLQKMDEWQHELESSIVWDAGDVLLVDVSAHNSPANVFSDLLASFYAELCGATCPMGLGG